MSNMIERTIEKQITEKLGKGRAIIIYGPRRVGKTTLAKKFLNDKAEDSLYLNCDELTTQEALKPVSLASLERVIGGAQRVVIDEAQRVENIGLTIKLLVDAHPELDIIATGSSSFDLANKIKEPLTGRAYEFFLYPLSVIELQQHFGYTKLQVATLYERLLRFGSYPGIVLVDEKQAAEDIAAIADKYVYKDSLELVELRQRQLLPRLLQALALQIGQEVSYNELATMFGVRLETIERYITLLEQAFIIYRLPALTGNQRGSLSSRKRKVYFYDLGVRNALLQSLQPLNLRADIGGLWENFCMNERMKYWQAQSENVQRYYWRAPISGGGEIDLVEASHDTYTAYEFKWTKKTVTMPKYFHDVYDVTDLRVVHKDTLAEWLSE